MTNTCGGESAGEVIEVYSKHARVRFPIGDTFRGRKLPGTLETTYGYKTVTLGLIANSYGPGTELLAVFQKKARAKRTK